VEGNEEEEEEGEEEEQQEEEGESELGEVNVFRGTMSGQDDK
jgi:hypothetical protein